MEVKYFEQKNITHYAYGTGFFMFTQCNSGK